MYTLVHQFLSSHLLVNHEPNNFKSNRNESENEANDDVEKSESDDFGKVQRDYPKNNQKIDEHVEFVLKSKQRNDEQQRRNAKQNEENRVQWLWRHCSEFRLDYFLLISLRIRFCRLVLCRQSSLVFV